MTFIEELEQYLMEEANCTLEYIKEAYQDRLYEHETYEQWLLQTAKANGYMQND